MTQETQHNKPFDPHEVDHGTLYYRMHWGAVYGHKRGIIRGLIVGCAIGAMVGLAAGGLLAIPAVAVALNAGGALAFLGGGALAVAKMGAAFSVFGGLMASELMGRIGNAAGNVASQLAEIELRERYPEVQEVSPDSPEPGVGHHYEVPANRDTGKYYHGRVGLLSGGLGAAFGALASFGGLGKLLSLHIPEAIGHVAVEGAAHGIVATATTSAAAGAAASTLPFLMPVAIGALMGSLFGINHSKFKSIFNVTDNFLKGEVRGPNEQEIAKSKERFREAGTDGPPSVITSLQRQEEYHRLQNGYFKKAFEAGFAGNARGVVGGMVSGVIFGTLLGGLAAAGIMAAGITVAGVGSAALAAIVFPLILVGTTKKMGLSFFPEAAFEASGHGHVHEVHHERLKYISKGIDLSFDEAEKKINERRRADSEITPPDAGKKNFFNPRTMLVLGLAGIIVGMALAPLASGVAAFLGMGHISLGLGAAIFGLTGASFGLGPGITEGLHRMGDTFYHGTFSPGDAHPEIKREGKIPLMSPRSDLAKRYFEHEQEHAPKQNNHVKVTTHVSVHAENPIGNRRSDPKPERSVQSILEKGARNLSDAAQRSPETIQGIGR